MRRGNRIFCEIDTVAGDLPFEFNTLRGAPGDVRTRSVSTCRIWSFLGATVSIFIKDTIIPGWSGHPNFTLDVGPQALRMLHCNMTASTLSGSLLFALEDLAAEVLHARRDLDLAQLATLCYCEMRPWARCADERRLAELSWALCIQRPPLDKAAFLGQIDLLIEELEHTCERAGLPDAADSLRHARMR